MKSYLGIFIFQLISFFVKSAQAPVEEKENFLRFYEVENNTSVILKEEIQNKRADLKPIRCFWLESNSFSVFDLKNLKRPFNQR